MTKKDYQLIAKSFNKSLTTLNIMGGQDAALSAIDHTASRMASEFSAENDAFDPVRFMRVVRGEAAR